ncbi:MAG: DUF1996 domain-containing protein [Actinomycetota bacterium]
MRKARHIFSSKASRAVRRVLIASFVLVPALAAPPASAQTALTGNFWVRCRYSHSLTDDPIVLPGQPGASHMHDFFGNESVNAGSTTASMLAATTTCRIPSDTAGYWTPTAYLGGVPIEPSVMRVYYLGVPGTVETIPPDLKFVGGNRAAASPAENPHVFWYCGATNEVKTPKMDAPYDCTPWSQYRFVDGVVGVVDLPNCWNGTGLGPTDVVYPVAGQCPAGYPHVLPRVSERVHFGIMNPLNPDGSVGMTLSSGPYYTLHADFWNTWQQARLDQLVADCLVAHVGCGSVTPAPEPEWTQMFGTRRYDLALGLDARSDRVYAVGSTNLALPGEDFRQITDAFVRAYDPAGRERWTDEFGTAGIDRALSVAATANAVYVVGSTDQALHAQKRRGGVDAFVRAFDLRGDVLWTDQFGTRGDDLATAVAVDGTGIYVAGTTQGRLGEVDWGGLDGFVQKYSRKGDPLWTRQAGGLYDDLVHAVAVDDQGVYVAGSTETTLGETGGGVTDGIVRAYRTNGRKWWVAQVGTPGNEEIRGITAGDAGVVVAGSTDGTFEGQSSAGGVDGFLRRLTYRGVEVWTRQFGSPGTDDVRGMGVAASGIFVAGATDGQFPDQVLIGETDAFLTKYNRLGAHLWTTQFGTNDFDAGLAMSVTAAAAYVAGETHGTFEGQVNRGDRDAFVTKLRFT